MSKTALIIGASSGVGASCLTRLAEAGYRVIGAARRVERISRIIPEGNQNQALSLDVTDPGSIEGFAHSLRIAGLKSDLVVYAVGVNHYGPTGSASYEEWNRVFATNVRGAYHLLGLLAPTLPSNSRIILIGSTAGLRPFAGGAVYCASKAALHAFACALRGELHEKNILVSTVIPGSINTEFWPAKRPDADDLLDPDIVARAVCFIAGLPANTEVTELVMNPVCES